MKACPYCAEQLEDKAVFCSHCGRELPPASVSASVTEPPEQAAGGRRSHRTRNIVLIAAVPFACVGVLLAVVAFVVFGLPYLGPKARAELAPDPLLVSSVDRAGLLKDAEILTARFGVLGGGISFRVTDGNRIIGEGPASFFTEDRLRERLVPGLLELVDFEDSPPEEGTTIATDFDYPQIPVLDSRQWHTVMTNAEFDMVTVQPTQVGTYQIAFTLTSKGRAILADFTTNNIGRYLGIVLDKRVISAPVIRSAITDGSAVIEGRFTEPTAQSLAAILRAQGPLPVPLVLGDFSAVK